MIPKQFKLVNYTWTVVISPVALPLDDGARVFGWCDTDTRTITLDGTLDPEQLWHTWLHELTHAILNALGRSALFADEDFVDSFSGGLAQVYPSPYEQFALTLGK